MLTGALSGFILIPRPIIYSLKEKEAHFKGPYAEQICDSTLLPALSSSSTSVFRPGPQGLGEGWEENELGQ